MKKINFKFIVIFTISMVLASFSFGQTKEKDIVLKLNNGNLEQYGNVGYKGSITSNVIDFDYNDNIIVVIKSNGSVQKFNWNAEYKGTITSDARKVKISGDMFIITKSEVTEKWSFDGTYKGTL